QRCGDIDRQRIVVEQISRIRNQHVGGKSSIERYAEKAVPDAEVLVAVLAVAALAAADPGPHRLLLADQLFLRVGADLADDAGYLVAEGEGQGHAARGIKPFAAAEGGIAVLDVQ